MMERNEFEYDSSMPVSNGPYWPQTLDHSIAWDCGEQRCPKKPHKGIWEIPIQVIGVIYEIPKYLIASNKT